MIGLTPPLEGGSQRHIYELSKRIDCDVLTQKGSICDNKIEVNPSGHIMFALAVYLWTIRLMFGKKKYDIIHIHENILYFLAPILCMRYKIIITAHGLKGFKFYDWNILWIFFGLALEYSDVIITVNTADQYLLRAYKNVIYIPNGVDLSLYSNKKYPVENKIIYIGRIHQQKGIDILLKALPEDIQLDIIGDDNNEYAAMLKCHNKKITWLGSIEDRNEIVKRLMSAYMIVLPSRWEGLPLTLFESLASGRPVIVSDIPAFKSVVTDNNNAVFFESENEKDLNLKIFKLIDNSIFADEIGKEGKKLAEQYDWNMIAEKTKEIYG